MNTLINNAVNEKKANTTKTTKTTNKARTSRTTSKAKKETIKPVTSALRTVYTVEDYKPLSKSKGVFRGYTMASMLLLGLIKLTNKGAAKGKQAKRSDFKTLVGATACNHWVKQGRLLANKTGAVTITAKGLTALNDSLSGIAKGGYNTNLDTVKAIHALFDKGGRLANKNGLNIDMRTKAQIKA